MNFEDVGRVWREEETGAYRRRKIEDLSDVLGRATRLNDGVRRRMRRAGWLVAVPLALIFAWAALRAPTPMAAVGGAILAVWALVVLALYLAVSRGRTDASLPVRLAIESEVARLRVMERFGRRAKWYRAVLAVGYLLYTFGVVGETDDLGVRIGTIALVVLVLLAVEAMILLARRRGPSRTRALREDLESWLAGLDVLEARTLNGR